MTGVTARMGYSHVATPPLIPRVNDTPTEAFIDGGNDSRGGLTTGTSPTFFMVTWRINGKRKLTITSCTNKMYIKQQQIDDDDSMVVVLTKINL